MSTVVLRKEAEGWKIVAGRVAIPAKPPAMPAKWLWCKFKMKPDSVGRALWVENDSA